MDGTKSVGRVLRRGENDRKTKKNKNNNNKKKALTVKSREADSHFSPFAC